MTKNIITDITTTSCVLNEITENVLTITLYILYYVYRKLTKEENASMNINEDIHVSPNHRSKCY